MSCREAKIYDFLHQPVLATHLVSALPNDGFLFPESNNFSGYAFDGYSYSNGVKGVSQASWATETLGTDYRGSVIAFPAQALLILTRACLAVVDGSTASLTPWMVFLLGDELALPNNYTNGSSTLGYTPAKVSYTMGGLISIDYQADLGSTNDSALIVDINLAADTVSLRTAA